MRVSRKFRILIQNFNVGCTVNIVKTNKLINNIIIRKTPLQYTTTKSKIRDWIGCRLLFRLNNGKKRTKPEQFHLLDRARNPPCREGFGFSKIRYSL